MVMTERDLGYVEYTHPSFGDTRQVYESLRQAQLLFGTRAQLFVGPLERYEYVEKIAGSIDRCKQSLEWCERTKLNARHQLIANLQQLQGECHAA